MVLGIAATALNIGLNVVLIRGLGPVPAFGTAGSAMGTVTAFGLVFTPVFYAATRSLGEMLKRRRGGRPSDEQLALLPAE